MPDTSKAKATVEVHAVIHRADGTVEPLGVVAAQHKNPLKQLWWNLFGRPAADRRIARVNAAHAERTGE